MKNYIRATQENVPYKIRISGRAKRVWLKMRPEGLEIVVPKGFDIRLIDEILHRKKAWINKVLKQKDAMLREREPEQFPPEKIDLNAVGRVYSVEYGSTRDSRLLLMERSVDKLEIAGPVLLPELVGNLLTDWLKMAGRRHLTPWLASVSDRTGFGYKRVQIRCQKSRWGSCSTRGTISLNAKLLFLPPEHVEYVLIHELCHTVHANHSPAFWKLVDRHVKTRAESEVFLKTAGSFVPSWADGRFGHLR